MKGMFLINAWAIIRIFRVLQIKLLSLLLLSIALAKVLLFCFSFPTKTIDNFIISSQKQMLWYLLEVPYQSTSNECSQLMFSLRNMEKISSYSSYLTLIVLWVNSFWNIFLIFPENRIWHFMQTVSKWKYDLSMIWHFMQIVSNRKSGPSCSKLTMSLVNDSLKFTSTDMPICWNFLLKKCE